LYEAIKSGSAFLELGKYADANALRKSRDICEATYSKSSEPLGQKSVETVVDNVEETVEVKESDVVVETPTPTPRKKITI
jgi:hypothetical protein